MKLTNNEIYTLAQQLAVAFTNNEQRLPMKLSFCIQKNKKLLVELAQDIEQGRLEIAQTYGVLDTEINQYTIPPEKIADAQKELLELFDVEQEVNICMIKADSLNDDIELTMSQMEAIMFMIEEA